MVRALGALDEQAVSSRYRKWMFLATVNLSMVADVVYPRNKTGGATIAETLLFSVMAFVWVVEDARSRNIHLSALQKTGVVYLGAIFVPAYIIRSRGLRSGLKSIAIFVAQFVGCVLVSVIVLTAFQMAGFFGVDR